MLVSLSLALYFFVAIAQAKYNCARQKAQVSFALITGVFLLTILAVHLSRDEQILRVRNLLAAHHAHLMKYVDTWTFAHLLP